MQIVPVQAEDANELIKIYSPYVTETAITFEYKVPSLEEFTARIMNISSKYPYLKAVNNEGNVLGYCYAGAFKARAAYDWSVETTVYVDRDYRKQGIGKELYTELERRLKNIGITNMNACIAMPEKEDEYLTFDSMHFHEKMGFSVAGTFHKSGFKFNRWYNMIWMEKLIGEHLENQPPVKFGLWKEL